MARLYADENVPLRLVLALRRIGHDCLTAFEAGNANRSVSDSSLLAFAHVNGRIALTNNVRDFVALHRLGNPHCGVLTFTVDPHLDGLAHRIDTALRDPAAAERFLCRVHRNGFRFD